MKDTLTHIHSRNAFEQKLFTCKSPKLFLVDIKQFKQINVAFGDEGGDFVLCSFAKTLETFAHENEMELYRIQDDKFALLLDTPFELAKMERFIFALCDVLKKLSYTYHDQIIPIETYIGISFDHFEPLAKASQALLVAKAEDQPFVTYSEFANMLMGENEEAIESMMKSAIENEQIVLHVQAVVDADNKPAYFEGLLRLAYHETVQSPRLFLKIAKERQFYDQLFQGIVLKALELATSKQQHLALNISSDDLLNADYLAFLKKHLDPKWMILEIQYENHTPLAAFTKALTELKALGITLALDNIRNTELLTSLPTHVITYVKVHGDLIRNFKIDMVAELTCKAIVALAQRQNIQTIATQLNSKAALEVAHDLGFDFFQGYIIEQPHTLE